MNPEQQASLLAEWLDGPPGAEPPPGLDADVVEGIYALRPERAPAARVTVDDILAGLDLAPAASPAPPVEAEVVPLAPRRTARYGALIGAIAAAAMALLVVLPNGDEAPSVGPAQQAVAPAEPSPAKAPFEAIEEQSAASKVQNAEPALDAAPVARPAPKAVAAAPSAPPPPAEAARSMDVRQPLASAPAPLTEMDADFGEAELADERPTAARAPTEDRASAAPVEAAAKEESARPRGRPSAGAGTAASSNVATPAPSSTPTSTGATATGSVDGLRAGANPADYRSDWYRSADAASAARVQALLDRAAAASPGERAAIYAEGANDADPRVAQDMAGRAASAKLDTRSYADALRYAQMGIGISSTNTAFLARLYYLQGRAYEGMGNTAEASTAYARATQLNLAR